MNDEPIPYGRQQVTDDDIAAVTEVLTSDWLTTGPQVEAFESAVADYVGQPFAVAVANGTAALHAMLHASGIGPGDEVVLPPLTFVATANAVAYCGATPVFADVEADTLLLDPLAVAAAITPATKAILAVDYAGQACDYSALRQLATDHGLWLMTDACHSLGGQHHSLPCGAQADLSAFSFHPVKPITTAEGGMVVTADARLAQSVRVFRNHGITTDHRQRQQQGVWAYEMTALGHNYRLSDLQCALGRSQLKRLNAFVAARQQLAAVYDRSFEPHPTIRPLTTRSYNRHGRHLYVVRLPQRDQVFDALRSEGIGCNVHYQPVYLQPWYRQTYQTREGLCPVAEKAAAEILSLPLFPDLTTDQQQRVINTLLRVVDA